MSDTVWIKHPDLDDITEVPADALPTYRQSGWDEAPKKDVAAHHKQVADDQAATEAVIEDYAARSTVDAPDVDAPHTSEEN